MLKSFTFDSSPFVNIISRFNILPWVLCTRRFHWLLVLQVILGVLVDQFHRYNPVLLVLLPNRSVQLLLMVPVNLACPVELDEIWKRLRGLISPLLKNRKSKEEILRSKVTIPLNWLGYKKLYSTQVTWIYLVFKSDPLVTNLLSRLGTIKKGVHVRWAAFICFASNPR